MGSIRKLCRLSASDRALLGRATLWLGATRIALWLLPLRVVRRMAAWARPTAPRRAPTSPQRIVWAVSVARRFVPRATCLSQALAAHALLAQYGHRAELRFGVRKSPVGRLVAHAWIEREGQILIGALPDLSRYAPLPPVPMP
jgi:Transglutaminase-like superfamily